MAARVQDVDVHDRAGPAAEHCANGCGRETGDRAAVHRDDPTPVRAPSSRHCGETA